MQKDEVIFFVEEDEIDGGFSARVINYSIFTEGDSWEELKKNIIDAVKCHFEDNELPKIVRILLQKEEILHCA